MGRESGPITSDQAELKRNKRLRRFSAMEAMGHPAFVGVPVSIGGALLDNNPAVVVGATVFIAGITARTVGTSMINRYRRQDLQQNLTHNIKENQN